MPKWVFVLFLFCCTTPVERVVPEQETVSEQRPPVASVPESYPTVGAEEVTVDVLDKPTLLALERETRPFGLPRLLQTAGVDEQAMYALLREEVDGITASVRRPLVVEHADALKWPAGNVGRKFDTRWLGSPDAFFSLAGVVNRMDRRDFQENAGCGEVRFIYRLAYKIRREEGEVGSRLPFTLNVVFTPKETENCAGLAQGWTALPEAGPERLQGLLDGPLRLEGLEFDRVEVNAQVVRFPSGLETEFAGQALYLLKVLQVRDGTIKEKKLENTPDVARLLADDALRADLVQWIDAHISEIDEGRYRIPDRFLATETLSYSTLGINRAANKPFSVVFSGEEQLKLPLPPKDTRFIASRSGLVERLDNGSCIGCHQAGSTAGFHLLGEDDPTLTGVTNRLAVVVSPHYLAERARRKNRVAAVASGQTPDRHRSHSLAPLQTKGQYGGIGVNQACTPPRHTADFRGAANWQCDASSGPVQCMVVADDPRSAVTFGQCVPETVTSRALKAGMTCRAGVVSSTGPSKNEPWNLHGYQDTVQLKQMYDLEEAKKFKVDTLNCRPTRIGVPLGRTYRRCTREERSLKQVMNADGTIQPEICAVVGGGKFDRCVEGDFHTCLSQIVGRGMVGACSETVPCREDAICQQLPWQLEGVPTDAGRKWANAGIGFCTPTYFLFQLRLDGHPTPRSVR